MRKLRMKLANWIYPPRLWQFESPVSQPQHVVTVGDDLYLIRDWKYSIDEKMCAQASGKMTIQ